MLIPTGTPILFTSKFTIEQILNILKLSAIFFACDLTSSVNYAIGGEMTNKYRHGFLYDEDEHKNEDFEYVLRGTYHQNVDRYGVI